MDAPKWFDSWPRQTDRRRRRDPYLDSRPKQWLQVVLDPRPAQRQEQTRARGLRRHQSGTATSLQGRGEDYPRIHALPVIERRGLQAHRRCSRPRQEHRCGLHVALLPGKKQRVGHRAPQRPSRKWPPSPLPQRLGPHGVAIENGRLQSRTWCATANDQKCGLQTGRRAPERDYNKGITRTVEQPITSQQHSSPSWRSQRLAAGVQLPKNQRGLQRTFSTRLYEWTRIGAGPLNATAQLNQQKVSRVR